MGLGGGGRALASHPAFLPFHYVVSGPWVHLNYRGLNDGAGTRAGVPCLSAVMRSLGSCVTACCADSSSPTT